ncbi:glycoside hydrolase family 73 protein [Paenibacillus allorhizosphaerae]|uniref:Mannosyl-glycoprotein endo-beta-N-acetylglucosamidase-like domain-containing protein n=1 Tax=Paenibacillus allorhizosphaerae TaxID=2849866 RepID=A0ABN7TU17_9BACL|nr:glucosaminidase domain-containing protein [Paenibacillus allorhizosphaerae]CAG7651624.1 hypothetical protein PAECIP111802_05011 [Paenibacillus allorhizosphaerae]
MAMYNDQEEDSMPSVGRRVVETGKDFAKAMARKVLKEIAKKLIKMLVKFILKLIAKLIAAVLIYFGIPAIIIAVLVILIGGGIIYAAIHFDWLSDTSGDTASKLRAQYTSAIEKTTDLPEYRPPMIVVQAIDNIRMTKSNLENTDIKPSLASSLKPDLTYKIFINVIETKVVWDDPNPTTGDDGETRDNPIHHEDVTIDYEDVNLLVKAHAWNRIDNITYHQEQTVESSGNTTVTKTFWVMDEACKTPPASSNSGPQGGTGGVVTGGATGSTHPFFLLYGSYATEEEKKSGVPASITLAQAALESGWGRSELASVHYNFFGIKKFDGDGHDKYVTYTTKEQKADGTWITIDAKFRSYNSALEGFSDHSDFLLKNGRYKQVLQEKNPYAFANGLQAAGYATDQEYGYKLRSIMHQYNLLQFDVDKGINPVTGQPYEDVAYSGPVGGGGGGEMTGCSTPNFTKFDALLSSLNFVSDDVQIAMLSIHEADESKSYLSTYNGKFMDAYRIISESKTSMILGNQQIFALTPKYHLSILRWRNYELG